MVLDSPTTTIISFADDRLQPGDFAGVRRGAVLGHVRAGAATALAALGLAAGLVGSAADEAVADSLLAGAPALALPWLLSHTALFAAGNLVAGLGALFLAGTLAARRKAQIIPFRRAHRRGR